jgi:hypothetical protein
MRDSRIPLFAVALCLVVFWGVNGYSAPLPVKQNSVSSTVASKQLVAAGSRANDRTKNGSKTPSTDTIGKSADSLPQSAATAPQCTLKIVCDPVGTAVFIDDSLKGDAPISVIGITPGNHVLTLKKKGYFLKKASITVDSATVKELSFVLLQPGYLKVETTPAGAELWIDDKKEGTAPFETDRIKPGDHLIKVMLRNYTSQEHTVTISNGGRDTVKLVMEYTREYQQEMAVAQATQVRERKEHLYLGIVSSLFVVGAIVMVFVEAMTQ